MENGKQKIYKVNYRKAIRQIPNMVYLTYGGTDFAV